jgi:hypothetical protein
MIVVSRRVQLAAQAVVQMVAQIMLAVLSQINNSLTSSPILLLKAVPIQMAVMDILLLLQVVARSLAGNILEK